MNASLTEGRAAGLRSAALFLLSAAVIGYELAVMRSYSVGSWSNFGAMVISIALLGFGLAGTLLTFIQKSIRNSPDRWLAALALALMPAMALAHVAAQAVPFNPVMIVSDRRQILWIGLYYAIYAVPFFIGALFINAMFVVQSSRMHSLYFWNMAGSGVGGLFILLFMYVLPPDQLPIPLIALGALTAALCLVQEGEGGKLRLSAERLMATAGTLLISAAIVLMFGRISVSEFKGISYARNFADARLHYHSYSPLGEMHVYGSAAFHFAPGLSDVASLNLDHMPKNAFRGLYIDGGGPIGIMRRLDPSEERYMDYLPMSAPYLMLDKPRVLLVGLGGGIGAFTALYHGASGVQVVESNPDLIHLLRDVPELRTYTGGLLQDPRVKVTAAEPRAFTASTRGAFDLVEISLIDSVGLSQAGGYSVDPNFTYTVEAIQDYMKSLAPSGVLSVTVWNKLNPPRNVPKLLTTVVESLRSQGIANPERRVFAFHLLLSTATVLVKNSDFTADEVAKLREFCRRLSFQVIAYPGMPAPQGDFAAMLQAYWNLFALPPQAQGDDPAPAKPASATMGSPVPNSGDFYRHMSAWLMQGRGRDLEKGYVFNIKPATDLRPFYTAYIKPLTIPMFMDQLGSVSEEWGYLLLLGTLLQSILFGLLIILVPLAGRWRELFAGHRGTLGIIVYYASLGLAYMLVEIFLIQKLSFFVADPIYAVSIVITSMLIISGLGSLGSGRLRWFQGPDGKPVRRRAVRIAAVGIAVSLIFYIFGLSPLIRAALGLPFLVRALIAVVVVAPAAFFMGMPFPNGLAALEGSHERLIPWAMGMNGALSVTGSVTAKLVSIAWGFPAVLGLAIVLYLVAGLVFPANEAAGRR